MRFHVTVPVSAVVTLARTYEIEAESEEQAKNLIDSDDALELDDDDFFVVGDDVVDELHSSEIISGTELMTAKRVG